MSPVRIMIASVILLLAGTTNFAQTTDLFISEYVEGRPENKAIELINYTGDEVDLSEYSLEIVFEGQAANAVNVPLAGTLPNGRTFVVANPLTDIEANLTSEAFTFNGNDAILLKSGDVIVDSVGRSDTVLWWGRDVTLRRSPDVCNGDTNSMDAFNPRDEWIIAGKDELGDLKSHASPCRPAPVEVEATEEPASDEVIDDTTPIGEIQGLGHLSPLDGETVLTSGIVTAAGENGFWLQSVPGREDGDPATSDAIYVFTRGNLDVNVGDELRVTATVAEYRSDNDSGLLYLTELVDAEAVVVSDGNALPEPIILGEGGRIPPDTIIDDDTNGNIHEDSEYDPENDGIDFWESLEGMRVLVNEPMVVEPTHPRFGEMWVVGERGANSNSMSERGTIVISQDDFNPERIQLDDTLYPAEWVDRSVGAVFDGAVVGVMHYSFGNYELLVTDELPPSFDVVEREVTELMNSDNQLTVASFNLENLGGNAEGTEFAARAELIVENLGAPDILALQEIQDSSGDENDGIVDAEVTLTKLTEAIAFIGGPEYAWTQINPVDGEDGGRPGGNIRNVYLYNPERVNFDPTIEDGNANSTLNVNCEDDAIVMNVNPGRIEPANDDIYRNSRKPLVAAFQFNGETIYLVNLHFRSKIGDGALFGAIQPAEFTSNVRRIPQAQAAHDVIAQMLECEPDANLMAMGDMNDYYFSEAIQDTLADDLLYNLMFDIPINERYTVIFQGNANVFDQILISENLQENWSPEFDIVHVNVEFFAEVADHDPVLARFTIGE